MSVVGRNIPHDSAPGHVSGESVFIDDMPRQEREVYVSYVGSPVAHGRIRAVHLEEARNIPGVIGLYTHNDIPGDNVFGPVMKDEFLLAADRTMWLDHPVVVIAAENKTAAAAARRAVKIDVEELHPIFTIDEAVEARSFIGGTRTIQSGDFESAYASALHRIEGVLHTGGQEHFYLENQSALVVPGEYGAVTVYSSTQHPTEVQEIVAHVLGIPIHKVICITKRMGGGFGGKESQATHIACMAALVTARTGRPARMVLNKDDDMQMTGKRHPFQTRYRAGFDDDGRVSALSVHFFSDGGCAADLSLAIMGRAMTHAENAYYIPNMDIQGTVCRTNRASNTAFRGFGGPQGVVVVENVMEEIAIQLGRDAVSVREKNLYGKQTRNTTPYGEVFQNNLLPDLLAGLRTTSNYSQRLSQVREFNQRSRTHLRGISMVPVKFGISFNTKFLNQASALVNIYLDGTVQVSTGGTEMGQGLNTKIRQLVADELGLEPDRVLLMPTSTEKSNNASATAASSGTDLNGSAAVDACRKIKARLIEFAAEHFSDPALGLIKSTRHIVWEHGSVHDTRRPDKKLNFPELVHHAYKERVSLGERGFYATAGVDFNWSTGRGNPFLYYTTGWACAEVLIDRFTGQMSIERFDALMDIGRSINPGIDRGQLEGAIVQGIGWVSNEELRYSDKGVLLTHSPTTYKIPNVQDVPHVFHVDWLENDLNVHNVRSSKAVGEPPFLLAISVWTAVKNALSSVTHDVVQDLRLPATGEEILRVLSRVAKEAARV